MHLPIEWLPAAGRAEQLVVLLHDDAGRGADMLPLAGALRDAFPQAVLLAPDLPPAAAALADELAALAAWLRGQQQRLAVPAPATALGGLGRGATLALEAVLADDGIAGRVLAFGGRIVSAPAAAPRLTTLHLLHGDADPVVPADCARQALQWCGAMRGDATLDVAAGVGHALHPALIDCALHRLRSHIPLRTWQEALGAVPTAQNHAR